MNVTAHIPITDQRIARWLIWAALWLKRAEWLCGSPLLWAPVAGWAEAALRDKVRWVSRLILHAMFLRALRNLVATPRRSAHFHTTPQPRAGALRAAIGVRLYGFLRGRTALEQIGALLRLLTNIEAEIARLTHRLKRGILRRRRTHPATIEPAILTLATPRAATGALTLRFNDSS